MQTKPSIVFCHGIWADGSGFSKVIPPLRAEEHEAIAALRNALRDAPKDRAPRDWALARVALGSALRVRGERSHDRAMLEEAASWFKVAIVELSRDRVPLDWGMAQNDLGTTLARRSSVHAVIAADLTLDALSATLTKHVVTPATEIVLFDAEGNAVAYPDSSRLIVDDRTARLAKAADLSPSLHALLSADHQGKRLKADGRRWIVARSSLQEGGPKGLQMALLVPEMVLVG